MTPLTKSSLSSSTSTLIATFVSGVLTTCVVQFVVRKLYDSDGRRRSTMDRTNGTS